MIARASKTGRPSTGPSSESRDDTQQPPTSRRYFDYALVQYVHQRREERLNVGVAVFDPTTRDLRLEIEPRSAAARVERVYPEVDRRGLEFFFRDMQQSLAKSDRLSTAAGESPLLSLAGRWQNIIQFSSPRTYPATSIAAAASGLLRQYLASAAKPSSGVMGVQKAFENTRDAIQEVLGLSMELDQVKRLQLPREEYHQGRKVKLQPLDFPFYLYDRFVIDTLSFENLDPKDTQREAVLFIDKLRALKSLGLGRDVPFEPTASITIDPKREDLGLGMLGYIADMAQVDPRAIVPADRARDVVEYIKEKAAA